MKSAIRLATAVFTTVSLSACVIHVGPGGYKSPGSSTDSVFGDVRVSSGQTVGNVSSVNGSVLISHRVTAGKVSTVNGNVEVGDYSRVTKLSTVNGNINSGIELNNIGEIETVNGDIKIRRDSLIKGKVSTVNGDINVNSSKLKDNIETHSGDVTVSGQSVIEGDIRYRRDHNESDGILNSKPTLEIASGVTLNGDIYLERDVELEISDPVIAKKVIYLYARK